MHSTTNTISLKYTVVDLTDGLIAPTATTAKVEFTGSNKFGTFMLPKYANTNVTIIKGGIEKVPSETLSNNDKVILSFTPITGYAWTDNTTEAKTVEYTVKGLSDSHVKVQVPEKNTTKGYLLGMESRGYYVAEELDGTTLTFKYSAHEDGTLKNDDVITIIYTLNSEGYVWSDGSTGTKESKYKVTSLSTIGSLKPTLETTPVTFTGKNGRGSYNYPFTPGGVLSNPPPNTLSNGDETYIKICSHWKARLTF